MTEVKTTNKAPTKKPAPPTLSEKFVTIFEAYHSAPGEATLTDQFNAAKVTFEVLSEDAVQRTTFWQHAGGKDRLIWVYDSDLTLRWVNTEKPTDKLDASIHVIGSSAKGPAESKAAAWNYGIACYLGTKFGIPSHELVLELEDYTSERTAQEPAQRPSERGNDQQGINTQQSAQNRVSGTQGATRTLSDAQLGRMYRKAEAANVDRSAVDSYINENYGLQDPRFMTRFQYDEVCRQLDDRARAQGGTT